MALVEATNVSTDDFGVQAAEWGTIVHELAYATHEAGFTSVQFFSKYWYMRVAVMQTSPEFGAKQDNLAVIEAALDAVSFEDAAHLDGQRRGHVDLWVLPELCTTGYQFRSREELAGLSEANDGATVRRFSNFAKRLRTAIVFGMAESAGDDLFNSAILVDPDGLVGIYRKVHLFDRETELFDPGREGFSVFEVGAIRVGMMVCFDWLFPESARTLALKGAQIIAHPANLVLPYCQAAMVTRAIENHVFTVTANRVGREARVDGEVLDFTGASRIVSPSGRILAAGPAGDTAVIWADIYAEDADHKAITDRNDVLADRRPDVYWCK